MVEGGGAGGVELSFTLDQRFGSMGLATDVKIIEKEQELLLNYSASIRKRIHSQAEKRGISVICNSEVSRIVNDSVVLKAGSSLNFDLLVWVAGPWSQEVFSESGFSTDSRGFVLTRST